MTKKMAGKLDDRLGKDILSEDGGKKMEKQRFKDIKFALPYVKFNFKKEEKNGQKNT